MPWELGSAARSVNSYFESRMVLICFHTQVLNILAVLQTLVAPARTALNC